MTKEELLSFIENKLKYYKNIPIYFPCYDLLLVYRKSDSTSYKLKMKNYSFSYTKLKCLEKSVLEKIYSDFRNGNYCINIFVWKELNNYTDEELDFMWDFCVAFKYSPFLSMAKAGVNWRKLNTHALIELPEIYEKVRNRVIYSDFQ